jgi:hypothetical protein
MQVGTTIRGTYCDLSIEIVAQIGMKDCVLYVVEVQSVKLKNGSSSIEFYPESGTAEQYKQWLETAHNYLEINKSAQEQVHRDLLKRSKEIHRDQVLEKAS